MVLWIGFAVLTAAVIAIITRPLLSKGASEAATPRQADLAVYRDQLAEIDAERERGLIDAAEAESARVELGRRVLAAAAASEGGRDKVADAGGIGERGRTWVSLVSAALIAVAGACIYLAVGAPQLPSRPHFARLSVPEQNATVAELVAKVEAELRAHPEDGRGWDVLAPVYLRMQRFGEAASAYSQAIRLLGESPKRLAGFAEATILANDGIVTEPARNAYQRLLQTHPDFIEARFWLAVAHEQDGNREAAADAYRSLLALAPEDARWRDIINQRLAAVTGPPASAGAVVNDRGEGKPASESVIAREGSQEHPSQSGATSEEVAAVQSKTPDEQAQFINQMVSQLAERLKQQPDDLAGWMRLVRAYTVLGRRDDALAALQQARQTFPDGSDKRAALEGLAAELGLGT